MLQAQPEIHPVEVGETTLREQKVSKKGGCLISTSSLLFFAKIDVVNLIHC